MKSKENFLNDFKLDVYRFTEANNTLEKKRKDVDKQLVDSKNRAAERGQCNQELKEMKKAAWVIVDMMGLPEDEYGKFRVELRR